MSTIGERLRAHWFAQGLEPPPGVTEDRLRGFETRFGVSLPADLREYFLHVDGTGVPFKWDDDLFNFRPLGEFESIGDLEIVVEHPSRQIILDDPSLHFVFADHSIWLPAYAIRLAGSATDSRSSHRDRIESAKRIQGVGRGLVVQRLRGALFGRRELARLLNLGNDVRYSRIKAKHPSITT